MNRKPRTYDEWRALFQDGLYWFGVSAQMVEGVRLLRKRGMMLDCMQNSFERHWRRFYRLRRIEKRLDAMHEEMAEIGEYDE